MANDRAKALDIRQAEERAQKILYQRRRQESVALAQDYLALLKFTREELVPALEWLLHLAHGVGKAGGSPESGEIEDAAEQAAAALSRAREMGA
jgi:hypothetical protein